MHKITFYQLSQHQPFPHLYLIGSTHQIFQKKREKNGTVSQDEVQVCCITSTSLLRTQNCSLLAQLWNKGSQVIQIRRSLFLPCLCNIALQLDFKLQHLTRRNLSVSDITDPKSFRSVYVRDEIFSILLKPSKSYS